MRGTKNCDAFCCKTGTLKKIHTVALSEKNTQIWHTEHLLGDKKIKRVGTPVGGTPTW